jgi:hypothetical protein
MGTYSGNTRVTLTTRGWLHMAEEALLGLEQPSDNKHSAQLRSKAKHHLRMTLDAFDADRPSRDHRSPSNLPGIAQSAPE